MKKAAALIEEEECDIEASEKMKNKTVTLVKKIRNRKPFVASSVLLLCVSVIMTGTMNYFCLKSKNNVLLY